MKKLSLLGRLYKSRRDSRHRPAPIGRRFSTLEPLEDRRMLAVASFPGNFAPPNLNLDAIAMQTVTAGQQITLNILTAGGTISDVDGEGDPTGDTIRYYLDPDVGTDTPTGATMTIAGVFTWTPTVAQVGTHKIVVIAVDSGSPALADAETFTVTVNAATPPAVVDLNGPDTGANTTATFTEDGGAVVIVDADATITDEDDTNLESATITLTNRPDGEDESLSVTTTDTSITANYNPTTGVLSLTGSDTIAAYQQVLRTLRYNNVSQAPDTTARVVNVVVNDGTSNSALTTSTVTIQATNDAPSVDLNGPDSGTGFIATYTEDGAAVAIVGENAVIGDVDSPNLNSATITISNLLDGAAELLSVDTAGTSITANYTAATGVLALTGSDSLTAYQQVLRTLKYSSTSQNPNTTARSITVVVNDGTSNSTARVATVNVDRENDEPDLADIDPAQEATIGILFELPVTATDPDGDELIYQLDRTGINTPESATITKNSNNEAVIRWTPSATDGAGPFTFRVLVTEQGTDDSFTDQEEFVVTIVTAPPSVDANGDGTGVDFAATFTEGEGATTIADTDLSVTDFDSTSLASATVTITNLQNGDSESLSVDTTDTAITANYVAATGVLTLTGSDTVENYQKVLRTLKYGNVSDDPGTTARVITIVVNDGTSDSAPAMSTVSITSVNDPVNLVLPAPYDAGTPIEVTQGSTVDFTATATDPDHSLAELTFFLDPETDIAGSTTQPNIDSNGDFLWVADALGTFTITVLVTDGEGLADQQTFTITVVEAPAPIVASEDGLNAEALDIAFDAL